MPQAPAQPLSATVLLNRLKAKARFRHLQVLVKLGELASVRGSADALGLSQPAVTQCLADLEQLIDIRLFDRHSRGLRMTRAGRELLPLARRMLDTLAETSEALTAARQREEGVVRIAAITGAIGGLLVHALPSFAQEHGGVTIHVRESDPDQWGLQLARGDVDLALVRQPEVVPSGFEFRPLLEDRFVVVCAPAHRMARRRDLDWQTLSTCTWLPQAVGSAAREVLDHQMGLLGVQPRTVPVLTRVSMLTVSLVQSLDVLALVPLSVAKPWVDTAQLIVVDLRPVPSFRPLGLVMPADLPTSAAQTFADFLARFAAANPTGGTARETNETRARPTRSSGGRTKPPPRT
jgi:DNA-binding transcriptional LysR family regulator